MSLATPKAVLLDALGTIVELEPPWPRLIDQLHNLHGIDVEWEPAKQAMIAEMTYYKDHHDEGRDPQSLTELRTRCAGVIRERLPEVASLDDGQLVEVLLGSLRFAAYPDVPGALAQLRMMGLRLVVVSNWDCSLSVTLAELGISGLLDAVVVSAEVGARKPAPGIFAAGLEAAGCCPNEAIFVGDSPETDIAGAERSGIRPLLLDRRGTPADRGQVEAIFSLQELPELLAGSGTQLP